MRDSKNEAVLFVAGQPEKIVPKNEIEQRIAAGEVIVVRGGPALTSLLTMTREELYRQIRAIAGDAKHDLLMKVGLAQVHEHLPVDQIEAIHEQATTKLNAVHLEKTEALLREVTLRDKFYVNQNFVLRFYLPNEHMKKHYSSLKSRPGKLIQHGPHLDFWQNVALNAINIWIAIEDVDEGNGMVVYREAFGQSVPRGGEHVRDDQITGKPMRLPCKAGDMLLFHSQHLHGGVLNRTDQTRVAITTRFTFDAPLHPRLGAQLHYASGSSIRTKRLGQLKLSYLSDMLRPRNLLLRLESKFGRGRPGEETGRFSLFDGLLKRNWIDQIQDRSFAAGLEGSERIQVVDERTISVKRDDGESVLLQRRCPHMGGDLACGYVEDNHIWCPWHDQGFSLLNGSPAGECSGLPDLKYQKDDLETQDQ